MLEGCYQRLLGLGDGVIAPDYYQLLGMDRSWIDVARMAAVFDRRLKLLDSSKPEERDLADFFRLQLQHARATLSSEAARKQYDGELRQRRLADVRRYAELMLVNDTLTSASERAILEQMPSLGVPVAEAKGAIDVRLKEMNGKRGGGGEPDAEAIRVAQTQLLQFMGELEEERIKSAMSAPAPEMPAAGAPAAPPEPERRLAMAEAPDPAGAGQPEMPLDDILSDVGKPAPEPAPAPATRSAAPAPFPEPFGSSAPMPSREPKPGTQRKEKVPAPTTAKAAPPPGHGMLAEVEKVHRSRRRWKGSLFSAFLVATGFAGGDLVGAFLPDFAASFDGKTASLRESLLNSPSAATYGWIALGVSAVLYLLVVWMAGRDRKTALFLIPALLLTIASFAVGLTPLAHERKIASEHAALTNEAASLKAKCEQLQRDGEQSSQTTTAKLDALRNSSAQLSAKLQLQETALNEAAAERDALKKKVTQATEASAKLQQDLTARDEKIAALEKDIKALKERAQRLEDENMTLRKQLEDTRKTPPPPEKKK